MKALILAAGFGKRLQPITNTIPKSMVEVNGTPLLINALNNLTALGITDIGIVVGHMADYIKERKHLSRLRRENKLLPPASMLIRLCNLAARTPMHGICGITINCSLDPIIKEPSVSIVMRNTLRIKV